MLCGDAETIPGPHRSPMKNLLVCPACWEPANDRLLNKTMRQCGAYYHPPDLFFQELWKQRLVNIGFRVILVEKCSLHHVWVIRLRGSLTAQTYLLVTRPVPKRYVGTPDVLLKQLRCEIQAIASDMGPPIPTNLVNVTRTGAYFQVSFIWARGKPGLLLKKEKRTTAFSLLIKSWLGRIRN